MIPKYEQVCQRQHSLITSRQLLQVGYSRSNIFSLVKTGRLQQLHRSVYRVHGAPFTFHTQILGAVLASPEGAVASHQSALFLHGMTRSSEPIDVSVSSGRSASRRTFVVHRCFLPSSHVTIIGGVPCTTLPRTLLDLAAQISETRLAKLFDEALATQRVTTKELRRVLDDFGARGLHGAAKFRRVLQAREPLAEGAQSAFELRFFKLVKKAGFPQPLTQFPVNIEGRRYILDACWPEYGLAVELDGYSVHGTSKKRFDDDRDRGNDLLTLDLSIPHFTARTSERKMVAVLARYLPQV